MNRQKTKKTAFLLFHTAVLLIMVIIFCFSAQEGEESLEISNAFLLWILHQIGNWISKGLEIWLTRWIRKVAHFSIYLLLGYCSTGTFYTQKKERFRGRYTLYGIAGLVTAVCYAASDEFHQLFIPGRSGQVTDVMLDSAGALTGVILCLFSMALGRKFGQMRKNIK